MNDEAIAGIKAQLDKELENAGRNVGIAFSPELFDIFRDKGWISLAVFGVLGTTFGATKLPAYGGHFAFATWDLSGYQYKVGKESS